MKKKEDEGLKYIKELGLFGAKSEKAFFSVLTDEFGEEYAVEFARLLAARSTEEGFQASGETIYSLKNRDLKTSLKVSGLYDADYYRKACNFIMEHREQAAGRVLDACCDNGILTCFIASRFPECEVVGVDCEKSSIRVARELAGSLKLQNVSFLCCDIKEFCNKTGFETVISSRSILENRAGSVRDPEEYGFTKSLKDVCLEHRAVFESYAAKLCSLLNSGGHMIQIERLALEPALAGWMMAVSERGLGSVCAPVRITASETGDECVFTGMVFKKDGEGSSSGPDEVIGEWLRLVLSEAAFTGKSLVGLAAQAAIESCPYEQEKGFVLYPVKGDPDINMTISCGWLEFDGKRSYVEYTVTYAEDGTGRRTQALFFTDAKGRDKVLADVEAWERVAKERSWGMEISEIYT